MMSSKVFTFLLIFKMAASQSVYPTTAVSYSTNSVPTVHTYPSAVNAIPTSVTPMPTSVISTTAVPTKMSATTVTATSMSPATVTATPMPTCVAATPVQGTFAAATPVQATCVSATPMSSTSPTVTFTSMPASAKVSPLPVTGSSTSKPTEAKAHFLPANIPDPKVTILSSDRPSVIEVKSIYEDPMKASVCSDLALVSRARDSGPMTPVKRVTMACADDVILPNEEPICPGISKKNITPPPVLKDTLNSKGNPIDFEGLFDHFMTCL